MSDYVFVTMSHDYADEFDVDCCFVADKAEFDKQMEIVRLAFEAGILEDEEFYFGTNECLSFYSFDDFETGVVAKPCTAAFYDEFFELNAGSAVGFCVLDSLHETALERAKELQEGE